MVSRCYALNWFASTKFRSITGRNSHARRCGDKKRGKKTVESHFFGDGLARKAPFLYPIGKKLVVYFILTQVAPYIFGNESL